MEAKIFTHRGGEQLVKRERTMQLALIMPILSVLLFLSGCAGDSNAVALNAPREILIGASIPKTGALAGFGLYAEWGYTTAINDVNQQGGLYIAQYHTKIPVKLITYDDQSDSNKVVANAERLIQQDKVNALLGSATPPLTVPEGAVANKERIPLVLGMTPIRAFQGGHPAWDYDWDMFFDELDMTQLQFKTMNTVQSNRKIALFTDTEQDGVVMGGLWEQNAAKFGYSVVYHARFPVGTTNYADYIHQAQASEAQIVIAQMETPDAITLWSQMKTLNYRPAAAFLEKAAEPAEWISALHNDGEGVMVTGYWDPSLPYPGARDLRLRFELDTGLTYSQHIADTYTAAQVLMDAIVRAGTLNPQDINAAIGKTDKTYVLGHINFTKGPEGHASVVPAFMVQWQHGQTQVVYPSNLATAKLVYPLPPWA